MNTAYHKISQHYKLLVIMLPIANILALVASVFLTKTFTPAELIIRSIYILGFDFFTIYYLDTRRKILTVAPYATALIIVTPTVLFLTSGILNDSYLCLLYLTFFVILGSTVDYYLNLVIMTALLLYSELFFYGKCSLLLPAIVITLVVTTLFEKRSKELSIGYTLLIPLLCVLIVWVIESGFVLSSIVNVNNLIFVLLTIALVLICYYINKPRIPEEIFTDTTGEPASETKTSKAADQKSNAVAAASTAATSTAAASPVAPIIVPLQQINEETQPSANISRVLELEASLSDAESEIIDLQTQITELRNRRIASTSEIMSAGSQYSIKLRNESRRLYKHCTDVAKLSSRAAELISSDGDLAYILGLYHEAARFLGDGYERILAEDYHIPEYISKKIVQLCNKSNTAPLTREAGIVLLTDDIFNVINYVTSKNKEDISIERIVNNTIKVRKDQNMLRMAGFSNEEIQLLKLFFIDAGGNYDTDN